MASDDQDDPGVDVEMEVLDSDIIKEEAKKRNERKEAALHAGIEPEQVNFMW